MKTRAVVFSTSLVVFFVICGYFVSFLYKSYISNQEAILLPPFSSKNNNFFPLGTDRLGRDVLIGLIVATYTSILVGVASTILSIIISLFWLWLSFVKGLDFLVMRVLDAIYSFPVIMLVVLLNAFVYPSVQLVVFVIAVVFSVPLARVLRARSVEVVNSDFFKMALVNALLPRYIFVRYLIPSLIPLVRYQATVIFVDAIMAESALSFLGFGASDEFPTLGRIMASVSNPFDEWWIFYPPLIVLALMAYGISRYLRPIYKRLTTF